jgi:hypothetical protein
MPTADVTDHADRFANGLTHSFTNSFTNNHDRKRGT